MKTPNDCFRLYIWFSCNQQLNNSELHSVSDWVTLSLKIQNMTNVKPPLTHLLRVKKATHFFSTEKHFCLFVGQILVYYFTAFITLMNKDLYFYLHNFSSYTLLPHFDVNWECTYFEINVLWCWLILLSMNILHCLHLLDAGNIIFYISTLQQDAVLPSI